MKKIITICSAILMTASVFAQSPNKMSYQAVIRNSSNGLVTNSAVGMRISILQTSPSGTAVYVETQSPTTNANGLASIEIGGGTVVSGSFSTIDWANGTYFVKTETDPNGGNNYSITGTSQLLSVPYALFAKTAETLTGGISEGDPIFSGSTASGITNTDTAYWNNKLDSSSIIWKRSANDIFFNDGKVGIGTSNPAWRLHIIDTLSSANFSSAISLDVISGNQQDYVYKGLSSRLSGTTGNNDAIWALSDGINSQSNYGTYSYARNAVINRGVWGGAFNTNTDPNGINYGVTGVARQSEYLNIAVGAFAENGSTTSSNNYGTYTRASSLTSGANYGIYSEASNGGTNYAGFFNGDVTITGTLANPSDAKLKSNIKQLNNAMPIIRQLNPVEYDYKKEFSGKKLNLPQNHQYGFVAQEIQTILPELVSNQKINLGTIGGGDVDGVDSNSNYNNKKTDSTESIEFIGVNYISIIPILVQGIKEQDAKINELELLILDLKKQVEELKKQ